jgi:hypothetical protein
MSACGRIESISAFAAIPRPLDPENGKVRLRSVFSLSKFKIRKALEIAVCIDGESLDIYSVRRVGILRAPFNATLG